MHKWKRACLLLLQSCEIEKLSAAAVLAVKFTVWIKLCCIPLFFWCTIQETHLMQHTRDTSDAPSTLESHKFTSSHCHKFTNAVAALSGRWFNCIVPTYETPQQKPVAANAVHNVYIGQFFFLSTESGWTHCPTSRLSYCWTYICPNALGRKEQWEN